ncbi:hypothetical protein [Cellulomonas sp.]|uniref:hypothetical protein n=1 Tax=Cellulomonas sp. TaxID=40001 RepID=UPI003BACB805
MVQPIDTYEKTMVGRAGLLALPALVVAVGLGPWVWAWWTARSSDDAHRSAPSVMGWTIR